MPKRTPSSKYIMKKDKEYREEQKARRKANREKRQKRDTS